MRPWAIPGAMALRLLLLSGLGVGAMRDIRRWGSTANERVQVANPIDAFEDMPIVDAIKKKNYTQIMEIISATEMPDNFIRAGLTLEVVSVFFIMLSFGFCFQCCSDCRKPPKVFTINGLKKEMVQENEELITETNASEADAQKYYYTCEDEFKKVSKSVVEITSKNNDAVDDLRQMLVDVETKTNKLHDETVEHSEKLIAETESSFADAQVKYMKWYKEQIHAMGKDFAQPAYEAIKRVEMNTRITEKKVDNSLDSLTDCATKEDMNELLSMLDANRKDDQKFKEEMLAANDEREAGRKKLEKAVEEQKERVEAIWKDFHGMDKRCTEETQELETLEKLFETASKVDD